MKDWYFQKQAVEALYRYFAAKAGNPLIAMPTGTGKSHVIADFCKSVFDSYPSQRMVKLTHVKELIEQNANKLLGLWPTAPLGIYSAGLGRRDIAPITYAGIASVFKQAEQFGHVDLAIVDEAHLVSGKEGTMYSYFFAELKKINPRLKIIGLSATCYRLGMGMLTEGGIFTDVCFDITGRDDFNRLIAEGYLSPLIPKRTQHQLDVSGVRLQGGEYVQADLQRAVDKSTITHYALEEVVKQSTGRKSWLVFTTGVEHTEHVAEALQKEFGVNAKPVHSKMNGAERDLYIRQFKAGQVQCLVNNNVLTTGFDHPGLDLIGVLRPTNSPVLWVQMLGRGTRVCDGKDNCLVLDFAGNTERLGPINDPVIPKPRGKKKGGQAPVRLCEACMCYNHASAVVCQFCGAEFPRNVKFGTQAGELPLIAGIPAEIQTVGFKVDRVTYAVHKKRERPDTLKVSYFAGLRLFQEYLCFEHDGFAKHKAHDWWRKRFPYETIQANPGEKLWVPETTAMAHQFAPHLRVPAGINVWVNKQHPEIVSYDFTGAGFAATHPGATAGRNATASHA